MEKWWNERYKQEGFIWHKNPSKCIETGLDYLKEHNVSTILDLPCGYGRDSNFLSKQGFEVTGIDRSKEAIKIAQNWANQDGIQIKFEVGDATNLPYPDNSFDAIVSNRFLHLVYDDNQQKKVISEIKRVLKDDGLVILSTRSLKDPDCHHNNKIEEKKNKENHSSHGRA